jgi:hypothetical protein
VPTKLSTSHHWYPPWHVSPAQERQATMNTPERDSSHLAHIIVCGAGSLGGNLVEHLVRSNVSARITVIDHDRVEAANVGNQPYDLRHCGKSKVFALAERAYEACGCHIDGVHAFLDQKSSLNLLAGASLVVDTLDNAAGRRVIGSTCSALGIPALHAGLGPDGYFEVRPNEGYRIAEPLEESRPCRDLTSRCQVLLAVAIAAEAIRRALAGESIAGRADTLNDIWERAISAPASAAINGAGGVPGAWDEFPDLCRQIP